MKYIWLVSHYSMPPEFEQRVKTLKYAELLKKYGYETKIFSASTIHNTNRNLIENNEKYIERKYGNINYVHIKVPNYNGNGISRILNMRNFAKSFPKVAKIFEKPYAIVADVNCTNYRPIVNFCKKNGIKFFCDIRDLWPLSIVEYLGFSKNNPIIKYLYKEEKRLYKLSDGIIFSMEGGREYIKDNRWDRDIDLSKVHYINNGVNIEEFNQQIIDNKFSDVDLDQETFKVIYCGAIRMVNNVGLLIKAAELLKNEANIKFLIYGDGDERGSLEQYCKDNLLGNVVFKGMVDKKFIPYILSKSSVNIINVQQTDILKYGCSFNKLFDYLAIGKPIISNVKVNYDLIINRNCGIVTENQDPKLLADAIMQVQQASEEKYNDWCVNARNTAREFDFSALTARLIKIIEN